jgi:hypothetical protein
VISLLAECPDLFDVKMDSSPTDCSASRFTGEASHEPVIDFVKRMTSKHDGVAGPAWHPGSYRRRPAVDR